MGLRARRGLTNVAVLREEAVEALFFIGEEFGEAGVGAEVVQIGVAVAQKSALCGFVEVHEFTCAEVCKSTFS